MTPNQVKKRFQDQGKSIAHWADQHGFARPQVYDVINGRSPCLRGKAHDIAVLLGIKPADGKNTASL